MKILHTSDWHIGKKVNEFSMLENQIYAFEQIYEIIEKEKIDVVIVAGDLYDKAIVDTDSIKIFECVLKKIVNHYGAKIIIICGNHDSHERVSFGKDFLKEQGIYIEGKFNGEIEKIILNDEFGEINFYPISYFDDVYIRHLYKDSTIKNSDDALKKIIERTYVDYSKRNIFIGHGYFSNKNCEQMIESDSERRLSIGGQEVMDATILKNFDYVALGHLHANQKIVENHIRYSGSIVKYSFSEMNHKKSVTVIELLEKGNLKLKNIELKCKYDMKQIEGYIDVLTSENFYKNLNRNDYYRVILHDSIGVSDPTHKIRKIYKNVMEVKFKEMQFDFDTNNQITNEDLILKSNFELFEIFFKSILNKEMNQNQIEIMEDVMEELRKNQEAK